MFCRNCGNQLDDQAVFCPKCGVPTGVPFPAQSPQQPPQQFAQSEQQPAQQPDAPKPAVPQSNPTGIVGFVMSLCSVFFGFLVLCVPVLGFFLLIISAGTGIAGLICGIQGYNKASKTGAPFKGLALAAIIVSAISLGFSLIMWILIFIVIAAMGSAIWGLAYMSAFAAII